jgi:hypothetical protein
VIGVVGRTIWSTNTAKVVQQSDLLLFKTNQGDKMKPNRLIRIFMVQLLIMLLIKINPEIGMFKMALIMLVSGIVIEVLYNFSFKIGRKL